MGITAFESNIRTMVSFVESNNYIKQVIKVINTGSNKYTVMCEFIPGKGIRYIVNKRKSSGQDLGTIEIQRVSIYGMEYNNTLYSIPDSVAETIRNYHITLLRSTKLLGDV